MWVARLGNQNPFPNLPSDGEGSPVGGGGGRVGERDACIDMINIMVWSEFDHEPGVVVLAGYQHRQKYLRTGGGNGRIRPHSVPCPTQHTIPVA